MTGLDGFKGCLENFYSDILKGISIKDVGIGQLETAFYIHIPRLYNERKSVHVLGDKIYPYSATHS